ncbi:hypothetical protein OIU78_007283 [Salix suchowensis]|nr:hypothetical protein OIU78_007283 [Salix suchowensis]
MKAWVYGEYGNASNVLKLDSNATVPQVKEDRGSIKIVSQIEDETLLSRASILFSSPNLRSVPGYDVAGVVVKVGSQVKRPKVGDEVYGDINEKALDHPKRYGSLAEYTAFVEESLANLSLFWEVSGGVGTQIIRTSKACFWCIYDSCPPLAHQNWSYSKSLGADLAIDYTKENFEDLPEKFDVVYDAVGRCDKAIKAVKEDGGVVTIAGPSNSPAFIFVLTSNGSVLDKPKPYLESGKVKLGLWIPRVHSHFLKLQRHFPISKLAVVVGKVVIYPIP